MIRGMVLTSRGFGRCPWILKSLISVLRAPDFLADTLGGHFWTFHGLCNPDVQPDDSFGLTTPGATNYVGISGPKTERQVAPAPRPPPGVTAPGHLAHQVTTHHEGPAHYIRYSLDICQRPAVANSRNSGGPLHAWRSAFLLEDVMAENTPTTWLTRTDLRARGWSKTMCRALLPEPENTIGPTQRRAPVWSLATIQEIEGRNDVQVWIRETLQLRAENLGRQLPACQCGLLSQMGQAMVRHLAYELALVAGGGDHLAALQALANKSLALAEPAAVGQTLYDLAHGR